MMDYTDWSDEDMWEDILRQVNEVFAERENVVFTDIATKIGAVKIANYLRKNKIVCHVDWEDSIGWHVAVYLEDNTSK